MVRPRPGGLLYSNTVDSPNTSDIDDRLIINSDIEYIRHVSVMCNKNMAK